MEQNFKELFRYLKVIYKRRHLSIGVAMLVATAIILYSYNLPRIYRVDSTVFIEQNVISSLVEGIAITPDMGERIRVLRYALLSRDLITKVLSELDVDTTVQNPQRMNSLVSSLQERTQLTVRGGDLFTVSLADKDPAFAQNFVNKLVRMYVDENISSTREETYGANRFLKEQIVLFKQKLDSSESAIIDFRRKQGVFLSIDENATLQQILQHQQQIEALSLEISTLQARKNRLNEQLRSLDPTVAMFSEQHASDRLTTLENRLGEMLLSYTESFPEVVRLKAEIAALRNRGGTSSEETAGTRTTGVNPLYQDARQRLLEVDAELSSLGARRAKIQELSAAKEKELQNIPEHAKELNLLIQDRNSVQRIYEELLGRMGQSEVSKQMEIGDKTTTFRIVDPAVFPRKPVSPNMVRLILLSIVGGLGVGVGLALLLDLLSNTIKDSSQLEDLGVAVLAVIPHIANPIESRRWQRLDWVVYSVASLWGIGYCGLLGYEIFGR